MNLKSWIMSGSTVVVGLNGALQKRFILPSDSSLIAGNVHRAAEVQVGVGGKGQDVAITLSCLKFGESMKLAQFLGHGPEGDSVYEMLRERVGDDAMSLTVRPPNNPLRTCTSIVASDATTELVEPSGTITKEAMTEIMSKVETQDDNVAAVCVMGTMPPGCAPDTYSEIYKRVASSKTFCLIDSVVGVEEMFQTIANMKTKDEDDADSPCQPTIFKVNASELLKLAQVSSTSSSETDQVDADNLVAAVSAFLSNSSFGSSARRALDGIAVTDGKHPAYLAAIGENQFHLYRLPVPDLQKKCAGTTIFPIGAGDAVAAGTLAAWRCLSAEKDASSLCLAKEIKTPLAQHFTESNTNNNKIDNPLLLPTMLSSFSFGLACGAASCLQEQNSFLEVDDVLDLFIHNERPAFLSFHKIPAL